MRKLFLALMMSLTISSMDVRADECRLEEMKQEILNQFIGENVQAEQSPSLGLKANRSYCVYPVHIETISDSSGSIQICNYSSGWVIATGLSGYYLGIQGIFNEDNILIIRNNVYSIVTYNGQTYYKHKYVDSEVYTNTSSQILLIY
jgi:hypothetical protein